MSQKAQSLLRDAVIAEKPFFLTIAPIAPHGNINMNGSALDENPVFEHTAPVSAKRHEHLFEDVKVPRTVNFNPDTVCLSERNVSHARGATEKVELMIHDRSLGLTGS